MTTPATDGWLDGRYELRTRLGRGAQGDVWRAFDHDLRRECAVKRLLLPGTEARARLAGEFLRLAKLDHPALVTVYELREVVSPPRPVRDFASGVPYLTSELVDGQPPGRFLAALEPAGRPAALVRLAEDVASGLAHLHRAGVLHRDVKPDNLLIDSDGAARLLDLGASLAVGVSGTPAGTPRYMSAEALAGQATPASDLHALGVCLYELALGAPPFSGSTAGELVRAVVAGDFARAASVGDLPGAVAAVIDRLLLGHFDTAPDLLHQLAVVREALDLPARATAPGDRPAALQPPRPVGNDLAVAALGAVLAQAATGQGSPLVELRGPPGAGQRTVFDAAARTEAVRALESGRPACSTPLGPADDALAWLDSQVGAGSAGSAVAWALAARNALEARAATGGPFALFVDSDEGAEPRATALRRVLAGETEPGAFLLAFAVGDAPGDASPGDAPGQRAIDVSALDATSVGELAAAMVGRPLADSWTRAVAAATGGLADLVVEAVRAAAAREGLDDLERAAPDLVCDSATLADAVVSRVAHLEPDRAAPLEALAVLGGAAPIDGVAATLDADGAATVAALLELRDQGLAVLTARRAALPSRLHARALASAIPEARARALHRAALAWRRQHRADPEILAPHLLVTGPAGEAADACLAGAERLADSGQPARAAELAEAAVDRCSGHARTDALLALARYALASADYARAVEAADNAGRSRDAGRRREAQLTLARACQRAGDLERASAVLARLHADSASGGACTDDAVAGAYARVLIARSLYDEARSVAGSPADWPPGADDAARAARIEAAGLARLYTGELEAADSLFATLATGDGGRWTAKALALRGMVAQASGDIAAAAELYRQAEDRARARRDLHAASVAALNGGSALSERGRHAQALAAYERALVELRRLGADAELAWALYNRGCALAALGEVDAARRAAGAATAQTERASAPQIRIYAAVLEGEVALREGQIDAANQALSAAFELAEETGQPRDRLFAAVVLAEARARAGAPDAAAILDGLDARSDDDRHRLALARARVALVLGQPLGASEGAVADAATAWSSRGAVDLVWRAHTILARAAVARGDHARATTEVERARGGFDAIVAAAPARYRDGLRRDPDALALSALGDLPAEPEPRAADGKSNDDAGRLRRLLAVSRRLNSELRLEPLLDEVIDTVIELTGAERGFLLLDEGDGGPLAIRVARNFEHSALCDGEREVSRSIAERAARTGDVVLTVDAAFDERFDEAASVAALKLRSVLAVPLRQKARVIGTIYADHRFRAGAFDDASVGLVVELAHVAGVAIHNARLRQENLRRQSEIARLNAELEREVERKDAELKTARASLPAADDMGRRYPDIVGRSAPMLAMLRLIDRAADSDLPVVIAGESGSGKELVARALHDQGRRAGRPFVAVNCGAVTESLLESELFGHVRGAFTGADRNRRGMFEVADGGTLFLDEIADTAPSMQAKLLRVLQEGEIRRVGDERTRAVDVRVVAASNQDLRRLVAEGRFREDLYFRLDVLHIDVPSLRDRLDDLPELAETILRRLAGDSEPPALDRAALARLAGHSWPGNVRELENEMARAFALADGVVKVDHLSPAVARINPVHEIENQKTEDLRIKPRVEALERVLVDEAMSRTNGNQTAAARLLGLSRYGLQKKLKRYGIAGMTAAAE